MSLRERFSTSPRFDHDAIRLDRADGTDRVHIDHDAIFSQGAHRSNGPARALQPSGPTPGPPHQAGNVALDVVGIRARLLVNKTAKILAAAPRTPGSQLDLHWSAASYLEELAPLSSIHCCGTRLPR